MTPPFSPERKWCYCLSFDDIIFLSSTGFVQKFGYVQNSCHIQFVSKHLT